MKQLEQYDSLFVMQKKDMAEALLGFEQENKYVMTDNYGNPVFFANEFDSNFFSRMFLKNMRPFEILLSDSQNQLVLKFKRPFKFIFSEINIFDAHNKQIGSVRWKFGFFAKRFEVFDANNILLYSIVAPAMQPWTFYVKNPNDNQVAVISKKWSGLMKEMFTNADTFGVMFESRLNVADKALLLGAVFLIDFIHFEQN